MTRLITIFLLCGFFFAHNAFGQVSTPPKPTLDNVQKELLKIDRDYKNKFPYIKNKFFSISTGSLDGIYYPAGESICRVINRDYKEHGQKCKVEASPGSIYNLKALKDSEVNFALVQSDWQEHAVQGTSIFSNNGEIEKLRHVLSLYTEAINVVVRKDSNIFTLDDIKSKVVNFGPQGSGSRASIEELMKVNGWNMQTFASVSELRAAEQPAALCDKHIDVMFLAAGTPSKYIHDTAARCEIRMIEVTSENISNFVSNNPKYSLTVIPGGVYNGVPNDIRTYGFKATLVTTTDNSEESVYNLTKSIFENLAQFKTLNPAFSGLDKNKMVTEGRSADYHSGAKKYYIEAGLIAK